MNRLISLIVLIFLVPVIACASPVPALAPGQSAGTCPVDVQPVPAPAPAAPQPPPAPAQSQPSDKPSPSDMVPRITIEELRQKVESGANILVVDNRSKGEYDVDHIKGAVSAPMAAITAGEWTAPPDRELVLY